MSERLADAFAGRSVLVTGHTGFKGSWLALWLDELGARVSGYALPPETTPALFHEARVAEVMDHHTVGDIRDREAVAAAVRQADPDVVLHLAARTVVREGYVRPAEAFSVNVDGTTSVLDAVRARNRPCAVVVVTSDKCYANDESGRPFTETDPLGGRDPYSASKAAQELVAQSYRASFCDADPTSTLRLASGRAGNVIGGGDWTPDGLVADLIRARARGADISLRNPGAIRPWQHVLEPLAGYLALAIRLTQGEENAAAPAYNFGPDPRDDATVEEVVSRLLAALGSGSGSVAAAGRASGNGDPHEAHVLRLSIELAQAGLGWRPRWRLDETIARTARWYRAHEEHADSARRECLTDIRAYSATLDQAR